MLSAILAFLLEILVIWVLWELIEKNWPALAKFYKALIVATILAILVGAFHSWLCGFLCFTPVTPH